MQPGDRVRVYGDPEKGEHFQGVATLRKHLVGDRWSVAYVAEPNRIITRVVLDKHVELPGDYFPSQFDLLDDD